MQDEVKVSQAAKAAAKALMAIGEDGDLHCDDFVQAFHEFEQSIRHQAERAFEERERKLREAMQSIERICRENVRETDAPDRVKWDGVWHEGPLATAYIQTLQAFGELARQALPPAPEAV